MVDPKLRGGVSRRPLAHVERYAKGRIEGRRIKHDSKPSICCLTWMLTLTTVTCDCAAFVIDQISSRALFDLNCIEAEGNAVMRPY